MAAALSAQQQVTQLLVDWSSGDTRALDKLIPLVQPELHRLAHYYMSREVASDPFHARARVKESSSCSCLEADGYNATSPDRTAVDFFVHQPGRGFVRGIQCHRRVVTPALDAETRVEVAGQEPGTGETSRPGRDLGICTQLSR